ncbi:MAG: phage terminase large subunit family protein, partial [Candidatus Cloacimonetes bacterium]|nr:phage terminase large subunit family protein [Candidatus Cloacimonadota bacterium]
MNWQDDLRVAISELQIKVQTTLSDDLSEVTATNPFAEGLFDVLQPTPLIDISEWAEQYRVLSSSGSAEPGPWRNNRTPYLVEIMKELSPRGKHREIVFMKSARLGATESGINMMLYNMHINPCSMLYLLPSEQLCRKLSRANITPSIEMCEVVKNKINKKTGNAILEKVYTGGMTTMVGSNSPNAFSTIGYPVVVADEIDRFPVSVGDEGDPIALIKNRLDTYVRGKLYCLSTPTTKQASVIAKLYEDSDRRKYL